ncbi:hypothetical protein WAE57_00685 [Acinetobacter sp. NS-4]
MNSKDKMKITKIMVFCAVFLSNYCLAREDLTIHTNRDIFEKMYLITMQPMLNYCRETQPQLNLELETAYAIVSVKLLKAVRTAKLEGLSPIQKKEMDQPVDANFKNALKVMLSAMDQSMRRVDSKIYCPYLISKLNAFDEAEFISAVEAQYRAYIERAKQFNISTKKE